VGAAPRRAPRQHAQGWFFGCHHAREWISVEVPYRLAEHLLGTSSSEPVQGWLQRGEVWVAPIVNPDGHEDSRTDYRRRRSCSRLSTVW
jgi:carboxypeptidase T